MTLSRIILFILLSNLGKASYCQDIFETNNNDSIFGTYKLSTFETFIKNKVKKQLLNGNKYVVLSSTSGFGPFHLKNCWDTAFYQDFLILENVNINSWNATYYIEATLSSSDTSTIIKTETISFFSNDTLDNLLVKWDSLSYDWYLPVVFEIENNGKKGYFPGGATHMRTFNFYAIDLKNKVHKSIYEYDLMNEDRYVKNLNFDYNRVQPTFLTILWAQSKLRLFQNLKFEPEVN